MPALASGLASRGEGCLDCLTMPVSCLCLPCPVRVQGEQAAVINSIDALTTCLRQPQGCKASACRHGHALAYLLASLS